MRNLLAARSRRRGVLRQLAGAGMLAFGALAALSSAATAADPMKVRIGVQYSLWGAPVVVAQEAGIFKKNGIEAELRRFGAGKDARDALIAESVDMATIGGTPFVVGVATGEMNAIATIAYTGGTGCVMAREGINSMEELKGKKIASRSGSTIDGILRGKILPALNMKVDDFEFVNVDFKDQAAAIAGNSVDALAGVEPFCAIAESQKLAHRILDYSKYDILPNMMASTGKFVEARPETARAVVKSLREAGELFRNDQAKVIDILNGLYQNSGYAMDRDTLGKLLNGMDVRVDYVDGLDKYFQGEADKLAKDGKLPGSANVDWSKALRTEYMQ